MDFYDVLDQITDLLRQRGRASYRALKRQFDLDDDYLEDLKVEIIKVQQLAVDQDGEMLVWTDRSSASSEPTTVASPSETVTPLFSDQESQPFSYTPQYLAEKILTSRSALEGERKQVTVMFADIKDSTELIRDLDPEAAQQLLDPAIHIMMDAVHRFEGTVNQVLGDGIMALFGAPIAHEDHAARACYAALAMQSAMQPYADEMFRSHGISMRIRVGLNSGEVVVRTIGNDLHMDYSAVGQTTNLASRMEQLAAPGSVTLTTTTLRLVEGLARVNDLGPVPVKGMAEPVEVYELTGASTVKSRLQASVARGLTKFVGRDTEIEALNHARERAEAGNGQIIAAVGEAGVGKSRLVYEFVHSHRTQGWLVLESASVSYGKATPYFPVIDLLKRYVHVEDGDDSRTIRAKATGQILTLDETLQETVPALLSLLDALPEDSPFLQLDPPQRRQRTLDGLKRILLRESQVQPLLLVFEDLHWIDSETQALLDSLVESLPTAQILLLVNYRPEYPHGWGSKTYYTQLRLDPLPPESADAFLEALLGDDPSLEPLKKLLIQRTEGNPFFLEESVRTLVETEVLVGESGAYRLVQDLPTIEVPATVQAILAARIDRLPQDEKQLLQTASVIGNEVPLSLLQAISEVSEEVLYRSMMHLQAAEFLYETNLFPERIYTFKHALTQNVAYQSLLTSTRQQYHRRIAQVFDERFPGTAETQPELLAHHYTEAGQNGEALGYWHNAGQKAIERSANVEAITHLNKGLELLKTLPISPELIRQELTLQITLAQALHATEGQASKNIENAYLRARELCERVNDRQQLFHVLMGLWRCYGGKGQLQTARGFLNELFRLAQHLDDPLLLLEAHMAQGTLMCHDGELVVARDHLQQAIDLYNPKNHRFYIIHSSVDPGINSLSRASWTLWFLGYPEQAYHRSQETLTLARQLGHANSLALAYNFAIILHLLLGEGYDIQEQVEATLSLSSEHDLRQRKLMAEILQGYYLASHEQSEAGIAQMQEALTLYRATGTTLYQAWFLALMADAYGKHGRSAQGLEVITESLTLAFHDEGEHRCWEPELHRIKGKLLFARSSDNHTQAETCFQQVLDIARSQQAKSWELRAATSLARLWQSQGKRQKAYELLQPVYGWFTEGFDTADLKEAKALLEELE